MIITIKQSFARTRSKAYYDLSLKFLIKYFRSIIIIDIRIIEAFNIFYLTSNKEEDLYPTVPLSVLPQQQAKDKHSKTSKYVLPYGFTYVAGYPNRNTSTNASNLTSVF